jgi:probable F420-dependent oxidoreductase
MIDRVGVVVPNRYEPDLRRYVALAERVERHGFGTIWPTEIAGADAIGLGSGIAVRTERIRIAIGVLPVYTRTLPLIAMGAATLRSLAGPRAVLGLGASTPAIVSGWHDVPFQKPVTRTREMTEAVRRILAHEGREIELGTIASHNFELAVAGEVELPIHVAALGPRNAGRAAEYADGVILTLSTVAELGDFARLIEAAAAGREVEPTAFVRVAVDGDREAAIAWMRRELAWYSNAEAYRQHFTRQGFGAQMAAAGAAWERRDVEAARAAIDDEMCLALAAIGSPAAVRERLEAKLGAGMREVACYFMDLGDGLAGIERQVDHLASAWA